MKSDQLQLRAGSLELTLSPSVGGSIRRFDWISEGARTPILRGCNSVSQNVLDAGSFPLIPYVNRIRGGRFSFGGRQIRLEPNMAGDPSPLHGQGWLSPWTVENLSEAKVALSFEHRSGEWPWTYEGRQEFALDESGLSVALSCRNLDEDPMPCGLGHHPYFPCSPGTRLGTSVTHAWTIDEKVLPVEKVEAVGRFDLGDRPVCGQGLDHGFGGWSGSARMTDPNWPVDLELSSPQARFFQLYSPTGGGVFVAEPVSHANAALNAPQRDWGELGIRVLERGEEMRLSMRLDVRPK